MNKCKNIVIPLLIQILFLHFPNSAQVNIVKKTGNAKQELKTYTPGVIVTSIMKGDSTLETYTLDMNENVKVIVEFKEAPLSKIISLGKRQNIDAISILAVNVNNEHSKFKSDLIKIENDNNINIRSLNKSASTQIHFEYKTALNAPHLLEEWQ